GHVRLMFERYDARLSIYVILLPAGRESLLVYFSGPEISRNRKQMRIPENGLKIRAQIRLYRRTPGYSDTLRFLWASLLKRFALAAEIFGKNDRLRQFPHGPAQAPALIAESKICLFFGQTVPMLQNALRTFDDFSC